MTASDEELARRRRRFALGGEDGDVGLKIERPDTAEKADSPVRIVQSGGRWCLESADGTMRFGCYRRKSSAQRRKRAIDAAVSKGEPFRKTDYVRDGRGQFAPVHGIENAPGPGEGEGAGRSEVELVANGDHREHPMKAGDYPRGDPRNDPTYDAYVDEVDARIAAAKEQGWETRDQFAERNEDGSFQKDEDGKAIYTPEREAVHEEIVDDIMAEHADVPRDREAVLLGGLPGAGKSTFIREQGEEVGLVSDAGGDPTNSIVVNPDDIKSELMRREDDDGNPLVPKVPGLKTDEHPALVHEESSKIARDLADRVRGEGQNVTFDVTVNDAGKTREKYIDKFRDAGYSVEGAFVDAEMETARHSAGLRHKSLDEDGNRTMSGRYVPYDTIEGQAPPEGATNRDGEPAKSGNRLAFDELVDGGDIDAAMYRDRETGDSRRIDA